MKFIAGYYDRKRKAPPFNVKTIAAPLFHPYFKEDEALSIRHEISGPNSISFGMCRNDLPVMRVFSHQRYNILLFGYNDYLNVAGPVLHPDLDSVISDVTRSDGQYIAIFTDMISGDVHIVNDRYASKPFFLSKHRDKVYFSSTPWMIHLMQPENTSFDPLGWMQITACDNTLGRKTHLVGMERLLPASHLVLAENGVHENRYWRMQYDLSHDITPEALSRTAFQHLTDAVTKLSIGKSGIVALSGGLDSRLMAALVPKPAYKAFTFINSLDSSDTIEVLTARKTAVLLGMDHQVHTMHAGDISRLGSMIVRLTGGGIPIQHPAKTIQNLKALKPGARNVMGSSAGSAIIGDLIPSPAFNDPSRLGEMMKTFAEIKAGFPVSDLKKLFRKDVISDLYPELGKTVRQSVYACEAPTASNMVVMWLVQERLPGFTFSSPINYHPNAWEDNPHLNYRFFDDMLKLKGDWLYDRNFYKYMVQRNIPCLRGVIYSNTEQLLKDSMSMFGNDPYFVRKNAIIRKLRHIVRDRSPHIGVKKLNAVLHKHWCVFERDLLLYDRHLLSDVSEIINSGKYLGDVFDISSCNRLLEKVKNGRRISMGEIDLYSVLATACYVSRELEICLTAKRLDENGK